MVVGAGDAVEAAKALVDFIKSNNQIPVLKMGALGARALTADDIKTLAALPGRPVLLAQFLGTLAAPMSDLVGVLEQKLTSVVYVLKAAQEKREKESAAA
jgi:large subunit ribosomal protein L10